MINELHMVSDIAPLDFTPWRDSRLFDLDLKARQGRLTEADRAVFSSILAAARQIRLYHASSARAPILLEGILPASTRRRNSLQSAIGWTCFSYDPRRALDFARHAFPRDPAHTVYQALLPLSTLESDLDQLRNMRTWTSHAASIGSSLVDSLIWGAGARLRGKVCLSLVSTYASISKRDPLPTL